MSRAPQKRTPDQWKRVKLGKICSLRSENYDPIEDGTSRYIGLEHIDSGDPNINRYGFERNVKSTQHRFYQSDILYGKLRPYLDKAVLANFEGICSSDILVIKPINNIVIFDYLVNILHLSRFLKYITNTMSGTTLPRTKWKDLSKFEIDLPNYGEQKKIISILNKVQNLIGLTQKIIERLQILKKGLMQRLFTEGIGHTELIYTRLGKIPEEWEIKKLGDLINIYDSERIPLSQIERNERKGNYPYCGATGIIDYIDDYLFDGEYVLLAEDGGPFGKFKNSAYIMRGKFWVNNHAHVFQAIYEQTTNLYLLYVLNYLNLIPYIVGSTRQKLNQGDLKKIKIPVPKLEEQESIVKILSNLDKKTEYEKLLKKILKKIKTGLMQELLTGKKRVKIN